MLNHLPIALLLCTLLLPLKVQAQTAPSKTNAKSNGPMEIATAAQPDFSEAVVLPRSERASAFWIGLGVGVGTLPSEGSVFAAGLSFTYQPRSHIFSARTTYAGFPVLSSYRYDVGALFGRAFSIGRRAVSLAAGVGVVNGDDDTFCIAVGYTSSCAENDRGELNTTLGFPLEVQLHSLETRFFDVGLYGFANFSRTGRFGGVLLHARLGNLR